MKKLKSLLSIATFVSVLSADNYYTIYNITPNSQVNFINNNRISRITNRGYKVLYNDYGTYHLGDERFRSRKWARLHGQCYYIDFRDDRARGDYYLVLERYGTESAGVFLNGEPIGHLPRQYARRGRRPNYWSGTEWIEIPSRLIYQGENSLAICATRVPNPEFPGDLDDFQIRNIKLIKEY